MEFKLKEGKRFSSMVDLNRITKKNTRSKAPLVLMFLGQSGLGMSTLIEMLLFECQTKEIKYFGVDQKGEEKEITEPTQDGSLYYKEISADLPFGRTIILDFPGFDELNTRVISPVIEMIKRRFASYLESNDIEFMVRMSASINKIERKKIDSRIHGCFYFVSPDGPTNGDMKSMKQLSDVVNLIPVIARADTLTEDELIQSKLQLAEELDAGEIPCYGNVVPNANSSDPESVKMVEIFGELAQKMPFALITSKDTVTIDDKKVFAREYSWGVVNATDERISDFYAVTLLVENNVDDLKIRTNDVVYEDYRKMRVSALRMHPRQPSQ